MRDPHCMQVCMLPGLPVLFLAKHFSVFFAPTRKASIADCRQASLAVAGSERRAIIWCAGSRSAPAKSKKKQEAKQKTKSVSAGCAHFYSIDFSGCAGAFWPCHEHALHLAVPTGRGLKHQAALRVRRRNSSRRQAVLGGKALQRLPLAPQRGRALLIFPSLTPRTLRALVV
jgi:hypothetical protein